LNLQVNLTFIKETHTDINTIKATDVKIHLTKYKYLENARKVNLTNFETVDDFNNSTKGTDAFDEISEIFDTLVSGVQNIKTINQQQNDASSVEFGRPTITQTTISIPNINITVPEPGEYALLYR
jgi:hypothetical protein